MPETTTLCGLRRELTKDLFEELAALQCTTEEILGYIGTTEKKLETWCRKTYRRPLGVMIPMIRKDGLIAIRRASFDQLKKSATLISQQYNRFLPNAGMDPQKNAEAAIRALTTAAAPQREEMQELFADPEEGGEEP